MKTVRVRQNEAGHLLNKKAKYERSFFNYCLLMYDILSLYYESRYFILNGSYCGCSTTVLNYESYKQTFSRTWEKPENIMITRTNKSNKTFIAVDLFTVE